MKYSELKKKLSDNGCYKQSEEQGMKTGSVR